jgi:hypothetical protein
MEMNYGDAQFIAFMHCCSVDDLADELGIEIINKPILKDEQKESK